MSLVSALNPKVFVSYSRKDIAFVNALVAELRSHGFEVFQDTSNIDPGDNFVAKLAKEIDRATTIIAVVSENYSLSRWAQAELYHAIGSGRFVIPLLISNSSMSDLDEPLLRLLRDTQYLTIGKELSATDAVHALGALLVKTRTRHRHHLLKQLVPILLFGLVIMLGVYWVVNNSNELENARKRESALRQIMDASKVLQHDKIVSISSLVNGDLQAMGEILLLSQEPSLPDVTRFNALALGSELGKGRNEWRWYVRGLDVKHTALKDIGLINTSFLGGAWVNVEVSNSTFSGSFWSKEKGFSMSASRFRNAQFFGGEMESITLVDVVFVNTKFKGIVVDTTNFSKVQFVTEVPKVEGNAVITPDYTLFERSILLSHRNPPEKGVLDLTMTGDDVIFDGVVFVDCRLEGWFNPDWFRNSSFERCELPESLSKASLKKSGNTVH